MIIIRRWVRLVHPYLLALGIGLFFPTVRKAVAAINRWVADAVDPQPPLLHTPAPTCTLQGSHDGQTWMDLARWRAVRITSSDGTTTAVQPSPKCYTHTRYAELVELPDSKYVIDEESNEAWNGKWPVSITSHLKATLEDARKQTERRGFTCREPVDSIDGVSRKVVCYREE
jgi:hypothetical protein